MKTKILGGIVIAVIAVITALNMSMTLGSDKSYNLMLKDVEAKAWGENNYNASELITYYCDDGSVAVQ